MRAGDQDIGARVLNRFLGKATRDGK